jgi:hypothetical protein
VHLVKTTRYAEWWKTVINSTQQKVLIRVFLNPQSVALQQPQYAPSQVETTESSTTPSSATREINLPKTVMQKLYQYVNETQVYYNVIRVLLTFKVCPHFYKPLTGGQNCSLTDIVNSFGGNPNSSKQLDRAAHVIAQVLFPNSDKPKINSLIPLSSDPVLNNQEFVNDPDKFQFNTLVLQVPPSKLVKKVKNLPFLWEVAFQVAIACYALQVAKVNHNRLQLKSVDVRGHKQPQKTCYLIHNTCYELEFSGMVFVKKFQYATQTPQTFQPLKDLVMFLIDYVSEEKDETVINELVDLLVNHDSANILPDVLFAERQQQELQRERQRELQRRQKTGTFTNVPFVPRRPPVAQVQFGSTRSMPTNLRAGAYINKTKELKEQFLSGLTIKPKTWVLLHQYRFFNTLEDIIFLLSQKCKKCTIRHSLPTNANVYAVTPSMFDSNGQFNYQRNHRYTLGKFASYISSPQEIDNAIQFTKQEIKKQQEKQSSQNVGGDVGNVVLQVPSPEGEKKE